MKEFSFLIILIVSIILSSNNESEACLWTNWFCDWITGKNNNRETTASITEEEKMQGIRNISSSINQFSFVLHKIMANNTNGSFISSPLSVAMVLMMAAYGARGKNANKIDSMLPFDPYNNTYKTGIHSLIEMFDAFNPIGFKLLNKIYAEKNTKIESDVMNLLNTTFKSSFENVDFARSEDTTTKINNWRAENDHRRITNAIEPDEISADTELFLINSIYFSALWKTPFNKTSKEETIDKPIMHRERRCLFDASIMAYSCILDFKRDSDDDADRSMRLILMIPFHAGEHNIKMIGENLYRSQVFHLNDELNDVNVPIPKFRMESTINLEDLLNQLGIRIVFEKLANFSGTSKQGSGLKMSKVAQKFTLEINELGIEAAVHSEASFANRTGNSGLSFEQAPIINTKSFVFVIAYNNTILFTGNVIGTDY